ncbi:MAG: hypothetical protein IK115_12440 [Lachnospiraceae bacterium]|nr:hypothetical protein [Lachnospiraceae bacterium]
MMKSRDLEMISRLREAAGYQIKAIRALIPERTLKHLDVIGNEIKLMLTEAKEKDEEETKKSSKSKKVEIS